MLGWTASSNQAGDHATEYWSGCLPGEDRPGDKGVQTSADWRSHYRNEAYHISTEFAHCNVLICHRNCNRVAHALAAAGCNLLNGCYNTLGGGSSGVWGFGVQRFSWLRWVIKHLKFQKKTISIFSNCCYEKKPTSKTNSYFFCFVLSNISSDDFYVCYLAVLWSPVCLVYSGGTILCVCGAHKSGQYIGRCNQVVPGLLKPYADAYTSVVVDGDA